MLMQVIALGFMPGCAAIAGFIVWLTNRGEALEDGALVRQFVFVAVVCAVIALGIGKTDAARMRLDPQFKLQTEMEAHPVYAAIKRIAPDDHQKLQAFLIAQLATGAALSDAFLQARPILTALANNRLGFVDQKTRLMWAQLFVDSLVELDTGDSEACYRLLSAQSLDRQTLAHAFSAGNIREFQRAVIDVYESADRGMRHAQPAGDSPADFNETAREYSVIRESITLKFGEPVSKQIASRQFPEESIESAEQLCAARIFQLEAMMERPQAMAALLVDSALR